VINTADPDKEIQDLLKAGFEYAYLHDDWVYPLKDALEGITAEQAAWRPAADAMGIWDIVLHVATWNDNIVERIETGQNARPKEGAWPAKPETPDEANWEAAKAKLQTSIDALRRLMETVPIDKIRSSPYGIPDLVCRFNHMGYHIGQIVKIRECQSW